MRQAGSPSGLEGQAPDQLEPALGWRVWDLVELDESLRLCSLNFWTIWLPGSRAEAVCRRSLVELGRVGLPTHDAPYPRCTCGIYATRTAGQMLAYARRFRLRSDTLHRVYGRVSLWGTVIESEGGWRGEYGYPAALFVPTGRRRAVFRGVASPRRPVEELALGLGAYGVPVEVVDGANEPELAARLEADGSP